MDKKLFNKSSNFFKREGFYVILFVCLCIVATVAAITAKNNNLAKTSSSTKVAQVSKGPDNSIQVKKNNNIKAIKTPEAVAKVSETVGMIGCNLPISGKVMVPYTAGNSILVNSTKNTQDYKNLLGLVIQCTNAKTDYVCAVLGGKVEQVITGTPGGNGVSVTINHQNGYKTVYSNLDPKSLVVKEGQDIKQGDRLGKTGTSSEYYTLQQEYGNYLLLQVLNSKNEPVNPATYIKY